MNIENSSVTPIQTVGLLENNKCFIKREDFLPFSFGGNKARKARFFFEEILSGGYDSVVTYGSSKSNHCRVVANLSVANELQCYIVAPQEIAEDTCNKRMMKLFGAEIIEVPVDSVSKTIDEIMISLVQSEKKPYFIAGGGHGNLGTEAYVMCYEEIKRYEAENAIKFDYIFHASGTGTTQAGLVCGQLINQDKRKIVGISIARKAPYGRDVVVNSVKDYLSAQGISIDESVLQNSVIFEDRYICDGYGMGDMSNIIEKFLIDYGIPLDNTYTGKAMTGMLCYLGEKKIAGKNILFIHTGGTPLFFDYIKK